MNSETVIYISMEVAIAFLTLIGNSMVCYVVLQSARLRQKAMYMFVTSLAIADITVAVIAIPFAILTKLGLPHSAPKLCIAMLSFIMVPTQISIFNLTTIAIERYIAIRKPRMHHNKLTPRRCVAIIVLTWILSIVIGMLPLMGWNIVGKSNENDSSDFDIDRWLQNSTRPTPVTWIARTSNTPKETCIFMQVMDFDYMLFNFAACVLPPLLVSALAYYVIFVNVSRAGIALHSSHAPSTSKLRTSESGDALSRMSDHYRSRVQVEIARRAVISDDITSSSLRVRQPSCEHPVPHANNHNAVHTPSHGDAETNVSSKPAAPLQQETVHASIDSPSSSSPASLHQVTAEKQFERELSSNGLKDAAAADQQQIAGNASAMCGSKKDEKALVHDGVTSVCSSAASRGKLSIHSNADLLLLQAKRQISHRREVKAATLLCIIVLCFAVCWLPIHTLNLIYRIDRGRTVRIPVAVFSVAILLSHANSTVNFFLYSWRLKAFRQQLNRLVLRRFRRKMLD